MKSLTASHGKKPEGCSKYLWKKSKKGFTKYVVQNDPEKYYAVNALSNIYSLGCFYDWVCYSMDWSLLGYPRSEPRELPQSSTPISSFHQPPRPPAQCWHLPLPIAFFLTYEVIEDVKKTHKVLVWSCYWEKSSTSTPQKKGKRSWDQGQQVQTKAACSCSQNNKAARDTKNSELREKT